MARDSPTPVTDEEVRELEAMWHRAHIEEEREGWEETEKYSIAQQGSSRGLSLHGDAWQSFMSVEDEVNVRLSRSRTNVFLVTHHLYCEVENLRESHAQAQQDSHLVMQRKKSEIGSTGRNSALKDSIEVENKRKEKHQSVRSAPPLWVSDDIVVACHDCKKAFNPIYRRKHHCRRCGNVFCDDCTSHRIQLPELYKETTDTGHRVCRTCYRRAMSEKKGTVENEEELRSSNLESEDILAAMRSFREAPISVESPMPAIEEEQDGAKGQEKDSKPSSEAENWYNGVMNSAGRMFDRS